MIGAGPIDVAQLEGPERHRFGRPERPLLDLAGVRVETGREVDGDYRGRSVHPGGDPIGDATAASPAEKGIDHKIAVHHRPEIPDRDRGVSGPGSGVFGQDRPRLPVAVYLNIDATSDQVTCRDITVSTVVTGSGKHNDL